MDLRMWRIDAGIALKRLRRDLRFGALVVPVLALAIGGVVTMSGIVSAVLFEPLPYEHADRLVHVGHLHGERGPLFGAMSYLDFLDIASVPALFASFATVYHEAGQSVLNAEIAGRPEQVEVAYVSENFFPTLQGRAILGRGLSVEDESPDSNAVAVLSHSAWKRLVGGNAQVIGSPLTLLGRSFTVVGVMEIGFEFPSKAVDLWIPLSNVSEDEVPHSRDVRWLDAVGRLEPSLTIDTTRRMLDALFGRLAQENSTSRDFSRSFIEPLFESVVKSDRQPLVALSVAIALVLLIACINLVGMLLVRAHARERDDAVQQAVGASSAQLGRHAIFESLALTSVSTAVGLVLAAAGLWVIDRSAALTLVRGAHLVIDGRVVALSIAVALLTGLSAGALPFLKARRLVAARALSHGTLSGTVWETRLRGGLVVLQVALVCSLAYASGLAMQSLRNASLVPLGLDGGSVLTTKLRLQGARYGSEKSIVEAREAIIDAVRRVPGVLGVSGSKTHAIGEVGERYGLKMGSGDDGWVVPEWGMIFVSPDYFSTLRARIIEGSVFSKEEVAEIDIPMVVNQAFARKFFAGQDILQKTFPTGLGKSGRIVAIVEDILHLGPGTAANPAVYMPLHLFPRYTLALNVRTEGDAGAFLGAISRAIWSVDPDLPLGEASVLRERIDSTSRQLRVLALTMGAFLVLAFAVVGFGIYGLLRYVVELRRREFAVRSAVGAAPSKLMWTIVRYGSRLTVTGLLLSLPFSFFAASVMRSMLLGVSTLSVTVLAATAFAALALSAVATVGPAISALRVPPALLLRTG